MSQLHTVSAWIVVVLNLVAGAWVLVAEYRPGWRSPQMWRLVVVAQVTVALQVVLGVYLLSVEGIEVDGEHTFYGFVMLFAIAILFAYRQELSHRIRLLYGGGSLFVMGLALRAIQLG